MGGKRRDLTKWIQGQPLNEIWLKMPSTYKAYINIIPGNGNLTGILDWESRRNIGLGQVE